MRIVTISDTHLCVDKNISLPNGDILIHAGDFCNSGTIEDCVEYCHWLKSYKKQYKKIIQIAGNHDFCAEKNEPLVREIFKEHLGDKLVYLRDQEYTHEGIKIYGSPWQPEFCNWAFNVPRGEKLKAIWSNIPNDTDILVTHGPPYKMCDLTARDNLYVGCHDLLERVKKVKPMLHLFGHIHEGYGCVDRYGIYFVNASICNLNYNPINKPIVFDFDAITGKIQKVDLE